MDLFFFWWMRYDYTLGGRLQGADEGTDTCQGGDYTSWKGKHTEQFPPTFLQSHLKSSCFAHKYVAAVLILYTFCATNVHKWVYNRTTAQKFSLIHTYETVPSCVRYFYSHPQAALIYKVGVKTWNLTVSTVNDKIYYKYTIMILMYGVENTYLKNIPNINHNQVHPNICKW